MINSKSAHSIDISYSEYYVAYLDVLGFEDLVLRNNAASRKILNKYFKLIHKLTDDLNAIKYELTFGSITISDSVILSVPVGKTNTDKITRLRNLCVAICKIQYALALENIWLRGAVSSGQAYFNKKDNQVVGPAYIQAYKLERRHAVYPRVIIDTKLIKELETTSAQELIDTINNPGLDGTKTLPWERNVLYQWQHNNVFTQRYLQRDVVLFIDYLHRVFNEQTEYVKILNNISYSIYSKNEVYSKYRWLVNYLLSNTDYYLNRPDTEIKIPRNALGRYYDELNKF